VNPKLDQASGLIAYPNIWDIPGPVGHVISLIPAEATPQLLTDCVVKPVKTAQFFTAGFVETGDEKGTRLQEELVRIARSGDVRLLGRTAWGYTAPPLAFPTALTFQRTQARWASSLRVEVTPIRRFGWVSAEGRVVEPALAGSALSVALTITLIPQNRTRV
jgi:hypothetical protein